MISGSIRWALADTWTLFKRSMVHTMRSPDLLVGSTISPVMFVLLFRYVFGGAIEIEGTTYVNFLMSGIFVQTIIFGSVTTAISLAIDLEKGVVERFFSLPMSRLAILMGRTLADCVRNFFTLLIMIGVGLLVGYRPDGGAGDWLIATALMLLMSFAISWMGAVVALLVRSFEAVQQISFMVILPLTFASSAFVETKTMPAGLEAFAENQPLTHLIDAVRAYTLSTPVGNTAWLTIAWSLGILAVMVPLSYVILQREGSR